MKNEPADENSAIGTGAVLGRLTHAGIMPVREDPAACGLFVTCAPAVLQAARKLPMYRPVIVVERTAVEVLAEYAGKDGSREWVSVGMWLRPGQVVAILEMPNCLHDTRP